MKKLKVVFHVEDEDKNVVVEKSQMFLEIGGDPHSSLTIPGLAEDHLAQNSRILGAAADRGDMTPEERETLKEINLREKVVEEFMMAAGDLIQRYVRLKLRDWAKAQTEKV